MKFVASFSVLVIVFSIAACASTDNGGIKSLNQDDAAQLIIVGKTRKTAVKAALGYAEVTSFANGDEIWVYRYSPDISGVLKSIPLPGFKLFAANDENFKELKIVFGKDGIVKKYKLIDTREIQTQ